MNAQHQQELGSDAHQSVVAASSAAGGGGYNNLGEYPGASSVLQLEVRAEDALRREQLLFSAPHG